MGTWHRAETDSETITPTRDAFGVSTSPVEGEVDLRERPSPLAGEGRVGGRKRTKEKEEEQK